MSEINGFLMAPGCPWVDLRTWSGLPNVHWCEEQLCSWITTPADTWSNLGYIAVGFYFYWLTRKEKAENIRFFGPAAQWVGWTSFIYHASLTFATQVFDFLGMFVFFYLILVQNFARAKWIPAEKVRKITWILTAATTALSSIVDRFGFPIQGLVVILIVLILATEVVASKKATRKFSRKYLGLALLFLGIGVSFSASDVTRKFCDPYNHWIQGHAIWHLCGAIALYFSIHYYRQFYSKETGKLQT